MVQPVPLTYWLRLVTADSRSVIRAVSQWIGVAERDVHRLSALEGTLRLQPADGGQVTALSVGPLYELSWTHPYEASTDSIHVRVTCTAMNHGCWLGLRVGWKSPSGATVSVAPPRIVAELIEQFPATDAGIQLTGRPIDAARHERP
jgi:hypothetical protein